MVLQADGAIMADSTFDVVAPALAEKVSRMAVAVSCLAAGGQEVVWHREQTQFGRSATSFYLPAQH